MIIYTIIPRLTGKLLESWVSFDVGQLERLLADETSGMVIQLVETLIRDFRTRFYPHFN